MSRVSSSRNLVSKTDHFQIQFRSFFLHNLVRIPADRELIRYGIFVQVLGVVLM